MDVERRDLVPSRFLNGRRLTDDFHTRLTVVENSIIIIENDMLDHKVNQEKTLDRMCNTLDDIKLEISGAKGFAKAVMLGIGIIGALVGGLMAIHWLTFPVP